jgi:ubiquinone/menaquinone biosynthesis C-methylase UbiE
MANNDLLTAAELESLRLDPAILKHIEASRERLGLSKSEFRILDWGCGRGKMVLWLRQQGYSAFGVDIDPRSFANGAGLFAALGYDEKECLHALDESGRAPFSDSSFHFVVSWQTIEHVRHLDAVVQELRRVTSDRGGGFHVYPPHHRLVEGHLFMPFVHWLPKNKLRHALMRLFVLCGLEPHWWPDERKSLREKIDIYYQYSIAETFYRTTGEIETCFNAAGFTSEFVDVLSWKRSRRWVQACLFLDSSSRIVKHWYMNYGGDLGLATLLTK